MATSPTKAELAGELLARVIAIEKGVEAFQAVTEHRLKYLEATLADRDRTIAELREHYVVHDQRLEALEKHADHPAALAALDQRLKAATAPGSSQRWASRSSPFSSP